MKFGDHSIIILYWMINSDFKIYSKIVTIFLIIPSGRKMTELDIL